MSSKPYAGRARPVGWWQRLSGGPERALALATARLTAAAAPKATLAGAAASALQGLDPAGSLHAALVQAANTIVAGEAKALAAGTSDGTLAGDMQLRERAKALARLDAEAGAAFAASLGALLRTLEAHAPAVERGAIFTVEVPWIGLIADPAGVITEIIKATLEWANPPGKGHGRSARVGGALAQRVAENLARASGLSLADADRTPARVIYPERTQPAALLVSRYLGGTPLEALLTHPVPFAVTHKDMATGTHVLGRSGSGKSSGYLQFLLSKLLADPKVSIVLIDNSGRQALLDHVERSRVFANGGVRAGRLIRLDPFEKERPIVLNPINLRAGEGDPEKAANAAGHLLNFVFGSIQDAGMTTRQKTLFGFCARLLQLIPGATVLDLLEILKNPASYGHLYGRLEGIAQKFFNEDVESKTYRDTREEVRRRLMGLLEQPVFERMMCHAEGAFDLAVELNAGCVITVDTNKVDLSDERSAILARLMIALVASAVRTRGGIPETKRTPTYIIVDECHDVLDSTIEAVATQCRKYGANFVLANQLMKQVKDRLLVDVLASQVGVKIYGKLGLDDANALSREIRVTPALLSGLVGGNYTRPAEFVLTLTDRGGTGHKIEIPMGSLANAPKLSDDELRGVIEDSRQRFGTVINGAARQAAAAQAAPTAPGKPAARRSPRRSDDISWDE